MAENVTDNTARQGVTFQTPTKASPAGTPLGNKNRRKSLHSLGRMGLSPKSPSSPLPVNNDERERKQRRRSMAIEKLKQAVDSPIKSPRKSVRYSHAPQSISTSELTELYANCMKLSTSNKINQRNTWELNLIDYIGDVLNVRHGEMTNFQMASCTLDASVKIYSYRVDSVHSDTYKVLGGLSRKNDASADDEVATDGEVTTKKRKRATHTSTIEANPTSLIAKKVDMEFAVDPLFKKTSAAFDQGGARGLLMNHLMIRDDGRLIFDAADSVEERDGAAENDATIDSTVFTEHVNGIMENLASLEVCPSLRDFSFMGWKPQTLDQEAKAAASKVDETRLNVNLDVNGAAGGADTTTMGDFATLDDDFGGDDFADYIAFDDGDDDAGDMAAERVITTSAEAAGTKFQSAVTAMTDKVFLALDQAGPSSDYGYLNENILQNWAGPAYWTFRKPANTTTAQKENKAPKKAKEKFVIDFSSEKDWDAAFAKSRAATTLSKATLNKRTETLLPVDIQYKANDLEKLFLRPKFTAKTVRQTLGRTMDDSFGDDDDVDVGDDWYDYNNPNDNNFCAPAFEDTVMPGDQTAMMIPANLAETAQAGSGLDLVAQPQKAEKIRINYAKHAKRVNVRQLKTTLWTEMVDDEKKKDAPAQMKQAVTEGPFQDVTQERNFSDMVAAIPTKVPETMAKDLSVPIMFVCLLHLANEKHLKIENGSDDFDDLKIIQG